MCIFLCLFVNCCSYYSNITIVIPDIYIPFLPGVRKRRGYCNQSWCLDVCKVYYTSKEKQKHL